MQLYWTEENKEKGQALARLAAEMGVTAAQLALAWCLRRPEVTSVIIGASRVAQVEENVQAAEVRIPDEVLAALEELYPPPAEIPTV
jgi:aryl-alcohol dehydrogenase-like predicted oxidoreductase